MFTSQYGHSWAAEHLLQTGKAKSKCLSICLCYRFIPLQFLKDLQGVFVSAQSHGYHLLHSQARSGDSSFDIMTLQYKKVIGKANSNVFFILVSLLEQVMWALGSNYSQQALARGGVKNFTPWLVATSFKNTPIYLLLTQEGFCGSSSETSSSLLQL